MYRHIFQQGRLSFKIRATNYFEHDLKNQYSLRYLLMWLLYVCFYSTKPRKDLKTKLLPDILKNVKHYLLFVTVKFHVTLGSYYNGKPEFLDSFWTQ